MNWTAIIVGFMAAFLLGMVAVAALLAFMTGLARQDRDE